MNGKFQPEARRDPGIPGDLVALAHLLDAKWKTPVGVRVGWDGILGLVPGLGDLATTLMSGYIIARAALLGVDSAVLLRMGVNVLIDNGISMVPIVGQIGDFFWKSNTKNIALIQHSLADPRATRRRSLFALAGTAIAILFALLLSALLAAAAAVWAWKAFSAFLAAF